MALERYKTNFISLDPKLAQWHDELTGLFDDIYTKIGSQPPKKIDSVTTQSPAVPQQATFSVSGLPGVGFQVTIVNPQNVRPATMTLARAKILNSPNTPLTPVLHEVHSATSLNFDASAGLVEHGVSSQTKWVILASGQTNYWRMRSSFDGQHWNSWRVFAGPAGPISVTV